MRIFIVVAFIVGGYYWLLMSMTNVAVNQTMQLQSRYQQVAAQSEQIANGK